VRFKDPIKPLANGCGLPLTAPMNSSAISPGPGPPTGPTRAQIPLGVQLAEIKMQPTRGRRMINSEGCPEGGNSSFIYTIAGRDFLGIYLR